MAGQRCQVCGGKVVNGRCSLCGMPYRNDEVLYHLNEPREIHYKHASAKVRDMMRQYGQDADQTTQHNGNVNRNTNANRNTNINRNTNASRNTDLNRNLTRSRNTGAAAGRKTAAAVNTRNKTTVGRNRAEVLDQGKKRSEKQWGRLDHMVYSDTGHSASEVMGFSCRLDRNEFVRIFLQ